MDLRKAYLQINVDPSLWSYQVVRWKGQHYVLTRLGFGLNIAPKAMTKIVEKVLSLDKRFIDSASSYIDDIYVNEQHVSVEDVVSHLHSFGLATKPVERLGEDSVRVLGLLVDKNLRWKRHEQVLEAPGNRLTRRQVHKFLGEWLGHFPVCNWLRVTCAYLQRLTAREQIGWDELVSESTMKKVMEVFCKLKSDDPVKGKWLAPVNGRVTVWVDASNVALGVVIVVGDAVVEDAAWLRKEDGTTHINISELDAAVRGVNMAVKWNAKSFTIKTDSATVRGWLNSAFKDSHNIRTHAMSELLIRRRIEVLREIKKQEKLEMDVQLVRSEENLADSLTRVPRTWLTDEVATRSDTVLFGRVVSDKEENMTGVIKEIHERNHFGIDRTLELVRERIGPQVPRSVVKNALADCLQCSMICPHVDSHFKKGRISANEEWSRVSSDITHVGSSVYLTVIDTYSRFCIWKLMKNETAKEVCFALNTIFSEFGPPKSLLSDNGTVYRSSEMRTLFEHWNVQHEFACAFRPQGNGISERNHRTIKTMAARSKNSIEECVFWYNVTSSVDGLAPFNVIFHCKPRIPSVRDKRIHTCHEVAVKIPYGRDEEEFTNPYVIGDKVFLRTDGKCDSAWSGPHRITMIKSPVSIELNGDGITRHVSHVKRVPGTTTDSGRLEADELSSDSDDDISPSHVEPVPTELSTMNCPNSENDVSSQISVSGQNHGQVVPAPAISSRRRGLRLRRPPDYYVPS